MQDKFCCSVSEMTIVNSDFYVPDLKVYWSCDIQQVEVLVGAGFEGGGRGGSIWFEDGGGGGSNVMCLCEEYVKKTLKFCCGSPRK